MRSLSCPNGLNFASFSSQRHSNCFTGSVGSVCARQHQRHHGVVFQLYNDKILTTVTPTMEFNVTRINCVRLSSPVIVSQTIVKTQAQVHWTSSSTDRHASCFHSSLQLVSTNYCIISLQFALLRRFSSFFHRAVATRCSVLVSLTSRHALLRALFLSLLGVDCFCLRAPLRCAGPNVRMSD